MGLSLGRALTGVATGGLSEVARGVGNAVSGGGDNGGGGGNVPQVDPRLKAIAAEQDKAAEDFKNNLPAYKNEQYNMAADTMKRGLAGDLKGIDQAANGRGLLYSGLRQGSRAQTQMGLAGNLSQAKADVNQAAEDQARQLEMNAIGTGMGMLNANMGNQQLAYQQALNKYAAQQAQKGAIGGMLGSIGGAAFGGAGGAIAGNQAGSALGGLF